MAHSDPAAPGRPQPARRKDRSGAGSQDIPARNRPDTPPPEAEPDDASQAPESGEKPDVMPPRQRPVR